MARAALDERPRAIEAYRIAMLRNSLLKFFTETLEEARS